MLVLCSLLYLFYIEEAVTDTRIYAILHPLLPERKLNRVKTIFQAVSYLQWIRVTSTSVLPMLLTLWIRLAAFFICLTKVNQELRQTVLLLFKAASHS